MTTKAITYGQLFNTLKDLGFEDQVIPWNGSTQHVFRHKERKKAMDFLPDVSPSEPATSMHINATRSVLKNHGLIGEDESVLV